MARALNLKLLPVILTLLTLTSRATYSQDTINDSGPRLESAITVFLDMSTGYSDYIKEEIRFVNYVRESEQSQVHIQLTSQTTGTRDTEYTVTLIGRKEFHGLNDTLSTITKDIDTIEYKRSEIARLIKLGLVRYVSNTPYLDDLDVVYTAKEEPQEMIDRWDCWIFSVDISGSINGEESVFGTTFNGDLTADRVTDELKLNFGVSTSYSEDRFEYGTLKVTSISRWNNFRGLIVKSINEHWSAGGYLSASKSMHYNINAAYGIAPAIEYDYFPYSESKHRNFRILYKIGFTRNEYAEETIFFKIEEDLYYQSLSIEIDAKARWGTLRIILDGSHYFHDFDLNRLTFYSYIYVRILEGLSLNVGGSYSAIHDQIGLPRRGATEDEVLLRRRQIATQYRYGISLGIQYRFGSKQSNIVNPRF